MKERKPISISSSITSSDDGAVLIERVAICNDGTVWHQQGSPMNEWARMADIPQPGGNPNEEEGGEA